MRPSEALAVAQAAMRVDRDTNDWLQGMCAALSRARGTIGTLAYCFELRPEGLSIDGFILDGVASAEFNDEGLAALGPAETVRVYGNGAIATTALSAFGGVLPPALEPSWARLGIGDVLGLIATNEGKRGVLVGGIESERLPAAVTCRAQTIADALRTSLALRSALAGARLEDVVQAVFDPDGTTQGLNRGAREVKLSMLRDLVRCREAARARAEQDDDAAALRAWSRLCAGECRLVDYVDRDGKRFVVMIAEDGATKRALTPVEARIARLCGQAFSNKQIGFALGLSETAVENHVARVIGKLGLRHRVDLVRLYTELERAEAS